MAVTRSNTKPTASILTIGDEILNGRIVNSNAAEIARLAGEAGLSVARSLSLPDERRVIARAVKACREDVVFVTGGLGPTSDDLTAEALGLAYGEKMVYHEPQAVRIREFFRIRGRAPDEVNFRQAWIPGGFRVLENDWGTAPCLARKPKAGRPLLFAMPGVPREMRPLMTERVLPEIRSHFRLPPRLSLELRTVGIGESDLYAKVRSLPVPRGMSLAFLPSPGEVLVRFGGMDRSALSRASRPFAKKLSPHLVSSDGRSLEAVVLDRFSEKRWHLGTAESCTGGLIAARLTSVPGSSRVFDTGVVTYANESKTRWLGVSASLLERYGAVSGETVLAMARGLAKRRRLDGAIAVSGVAGPDGGSDEKPVGTVWIASLLGKRLRTEKYLFHGDRQDIRLRATQEGLRQLWEMLAARP
ncbi:MAG: nicotinamide-nucleotide amidohydrolase family protein [Spirochaetes bacterium]|nr:nicotinamide-nucleotide amidohydrolase family protein [Spirochaetota bacterium]